MVSTTRRSTAAICENIHKLVGTCSSAASPGDGATRRVRIMEVCGTHTMAIARGGLRSLLPETLRLISGPGCPVCVTDQDYIDRAIALARRDDVIVATYGDMVRVPGRGGSLAEARAAGATVEVVYAAERAVDLARCHPQRQVVFLAVGFETTTPATALALRKARDAGVENFSVLTAHKLIIPAMRHLLAAGDVPIDAFLCPGHVSVILGWRAYEPLADGFARPCVVAGFETAQIVLGVEAICRQLADGRAAEENVYPAVTADGNHTAQALLDEVFRPADAAWRGLGVIPASGLVLRDAWGDFDAAGRFELPDADALPDVPELAHCRCGDVISGRCRPRDCGLFARRCTPSDPVGPCMVSSEGACAAAFKYERRS
ncbi:MAG: hydrogenase formation protein HypD [Phycisphaerae bacterium]|nr:hydrogenase formation protein HypD [Phycisphaerae bacterium]